MDFEELICSICKQHFDSDGHLPRMIPKCGHTYCTQCIVDIIQSRSTSSDYLFCCPDDNFIIRLKNRDITSFPINFLLASLVGKKAHVMNSKTLQTAEKDEYIPNAKKHSSSRSLSTTGSPDNDESSIHSIKPHEKKSFNKCSEHGKELEIVCVQDQCRICSSCALFGAHKNHDIKPEGEILTEVAARAESIVDLFQKIQKQEEAILENQNASYIQKKLSERQNELAIMIKDKFKEYITILKTQERCLLAELDEKFKDVRERIIQGKKISQELIDRTNKWKASAEKTLTIMSEKSEKGDIAYELLKKTDNPKEDIVLIGQNVMYELYKTKEKMLRKLDGQEMEICVSFNDNFLKPTDFLCQITSSIEGLSRRFENSLNSCASHSMMPEINLCKRNEVASEDEIPVRLNETQYSQLHPSTNFGKFLDNRKSNDTDLLSFELKDLNIAELAESNHLARFAQPEASETRDLESSRARASKKRERASRGFEGSEALANITNRSISNASNVKREGKQVSTRKADDSYISVSRDTSRSQKRSVSPLKRGESYERLPKSSRSRKNKEIQVSEKYEPILEGIMLNIIDSADLTGAELGDIGIQKLAEYLKANTKLRSLKLLKNKITDEGGSILADALAYNRTLQTLNLTQNLLTEKTVDAFMELVKTRKNIKSIYFNQNPISLRNVKTKIREMEILGVSVSI